jgi:hypothetical protein
MLKSIITNVRLEVISSKSLFSILYFILAIFIFIFWFSSIQQFFYGYFVLGEFDVTTFDFIVIEIFLFLPFYVFGGLISAALIQRIRLNYWFKTRLNVAQYESNLKPAEAGLLCDYEFSIEEVHATLVDLHLRNRIKITHLDNKVIIKLISFSGLKYYEKILLDCLFLTEFDTIELMNLNDPILLNSGTIMHQQILSGFERTGIMPKTGKSNTYRKTVRALMIFSLLLSTFYVATLLLYPESILNINYPRYSLESVTLYLVIFTSMVYFLIIFSGFFPRLKNDYKSGASLAWLQSEGYKMYLNKVIKPRIEEDVNNIDANTFKEVLPYLLAFKQIKLNITLIKMLDKLSLQANVLPYRD